MRAAAFVLLIAYFCSACFSYVPAASVPRSMGEPVRVYLSQPQTVELAEVVAGNIVRVDGEIASVDDREVVVSAWSLHGGSGTEYAGEGRTVRVPAEAVERVERKEFSWLQTGGIVALGVLAGVLFAAAEGGFSGDGRGPPPTGGGK